MQVRYLRASVFCPKCIKLISCATAASHDSPLLSHMKPLSFPIPPNPAQTAYIPFPHSRDIPETLDSVIAIHIILVKHSVLFKVRHEATHALVMEGTWIERVCTQ